jgi:hypothetical protein
MAGTARERAIAGIAEPVDMKDIAEHASDQRAQVQYQAGPLLDENAPIERSRDRSFSKTILRRCDNQYLPWCR